jgi:hypothetical protein
MREIDAVFAVQDIDFVFFSHVPGLAARTFSNPFCRRAIFFPRRGTKQWKTHHVFARRNYHQHCALPRGKLLT